MAKIVQYESAKALQGLQVSDQGVSAYEHAGRNIGVAISQIGGEVQKDIDLYDQHQTMDQQSQMSDQFIKADQDIEQAKKDNLAKNASPSDFVDSIVPTLDKIEGTATTDRAKAYYQAKRAQVLEGASKDYVAQYGLMAGANLENSLKNSVSSAQKKALTDPVNTADAARGALLDINYAMDNSPTAKLSPQQRADATQKTREQIYDAGADGYINELVSGKIPMSNLDNVADTLMNPEGDFYKNMSPGKLSEMQQTIAKLRGTNDSTAAQIAAINIPAARKAIETNGGNDVNGAAMGLAQALPERTSEQKVEKAKVIAGINDSIQIGRATKGAMSLPQDQLNAGIDAIEEKIKTATPEEARGLENAHNAAIAARNQRDAAFHSNPAGWLTDPQNNPTIAASYNAWKAHPDATTLGKFITQSMGEQARLYPNQVPAVLTGEMASHIGDQIAQAKTSEGGAAATAQALQAYAKMFGSHWLQATQELHRRGAMNDTLFLAASLAGRPDTVGLSTRLVQASFENPKELEPNSGTSETKAVAQASLVLKLFRQSVHDTISGTETATAYEHGLGRLLLSMSKEAGADQTGQAAKLARQLVLDQYIFVPSGGYQIRVPVSTGLSSSAVSAAAAAYTVNSSTLVIPKSYSGLGPHDQATTYIQQLKESGRWVTNADETGMRFVDWSGNAASEMRGGKQVPIEIKWSDIKAHPSAAPTASGRTPFDIPVGP